LSARYPIRYGLQTNVIPASKAYGLDLAEKLLPQYLAPLGYRSHAIGKVGAERCRCSCRLPVIQYSHSEHCLILSLSPIAQWHLGMFTWDYTPTFRGFVSQKTTYSAVVVTVAVVCALLHAC
jgi:hypothetical protein